MVLHDDGWISPYWPFGAMAIFALVYYMIADYLNDILARMDFKAFQIGDTLS